MEGKKISFGFMKTKKAEKPISINNEDKRDYIECVEEQSIKVVGGEVAPTNEPLVIPMKPNTLMNADRFKEIALEVESALEEPIIKTESIDVNMTDPLAESETLDQMAVRELMQEAKKEVSDNPTISIPSITKNVQAEGEKQSTLDDYEAVPIQEFGVAMLRGMGWTPGQSGSKYKQPELRPKGLGLGADKVVKAKQPQTSKDGKQEEMILMKNAFVKITCGKFTDFYGKVVSLDEDNGRVLVDIPLKKETVSLSEFMMHVVTKSEYDRESKVIRKQKGPHVSVNIKQEIIELHQKSYPVSDIARQLNIARNTVYLWIKRWKDEGILNAHVPSGRPRKLSAENEAFLIKDIQSNECNITDIAIKHGVSATTIRRRLYVKGVKCKKKIRENISATAEDTTEINEPTLEEDAERFKKVPFNTQTIKTKELDKNNAIKLNDEVQCIINDNINIKIEPIDSIEIEIKEECRKSDREDSTELQIDKERFRNIPADTRRTEIVNSDNENSIESESDEEERRKKTLEYRRNKIITMYEQKYSMGAIAKRLDIAKQAVELCIKCWKLRKSGNTQIPNEDIQKQSGKESISNPQTKSLTVTEIDHESFPSPECKRGQHLKRKNKTAGIDVANTKLNNTHCSNSKMKLKRSIAKSNYHISQMQREQIIKLYNQKQSITDIAKRLKIARNTVMLWIEQWKREGALKRQTGSGRPPKLSSTKPAMLEKAVKQTEIRNLSDLANNYGVSTSTIRRCLKHNGIRLKAKRKPIIKETIRDDSPEENDEQLTAKNHHISVAKKVKIVRLHEKKYSVNAISRHLNVAKSTVRLWIQRWQKEGTINPHGRSGRPRKLSIDAEALLKEKILNGGPFEVRDLAKSHGVSMSTIRRFFNSNWGTEGQPGDQELPNIQPEDQDLSNKQPENHNVPNMQHGFQDIFSKAVLNNCEDETTNDTNLNPSKNTKATKIYHGTSDVLSTSCTEDSDRFEESYIIDSDESQIASTTATGIDEDSSTSTTSSECEKDKHLKGKNKPVRIEAASTKLNKTSATKAKINIKQSIAKSNSHISQVQRENIIELYTQKLSITAIARRLKISRNTAMLWIERWKREGALKRQKASGRPPKLSASETAVLEEAVKQAENRNLSDLATNCGVSISTIRRHLRHHGIRFKAKRKPVTRITIRDDSPEENEEQSTAKNYPISVAKRVKILRLYEKKYSVSAISRHLNVARNTVRLWIKRWQKEGTINPHGRSGRPRKLSIDAQALIKEQSLSRGPLDTRGLAKSLGVSVNTIRRSLRTNTMNSVLNDEQNLPNVHVKSKDLPNMHVGDQYLPILQLGDQGLPNMQLGDPDPINMQFEDPNVQHGFQEIFCKAVLNNCEDLNHKI